MKSENTEKVFYLPNINGVRAIAVALVILGHTALALRLTQNPNILGVFPFFPAGAIGVQIFFVLSGFLITSLLLLEKERFGDIKLSNFYIRRALRIWPLYFLIIVLIYLLFAFTDWMLMPGIAPKFERMQYKMLPYFVAMLPNVGKALFPSAELYLMVLWSIGIEEQFYLIWPLLVKMSGRILVVLVTAVFLFLLAGTIYQDILPLILPTSHPLFSFKVSKLMQYTLLGGFDSLAIGSLCAYLLHKKTNWLQGLISRRAAIRLCLVLIIPISIFYTDLPHLLKVGVLSSCFALIIGHLSYISKPLFQLNNKVFKWTGIYSYGLYIYHFPVMLIVANMLSRMAPTVPLWLYTALFIVISYSFSVMLAALSYHHFEKPFLRLKEKFMLVKSSARGA